MKKYLIVTAVLVALVLLIGAPVASAEGGTDCITPSQTLNWGGGMPFYSDSRVHVCQPGDAFKMTINFQTAAKGAYLLRVVPDDTLTVARYSDGVSNPVDLLPLLKMVTVTTTSPADATLRAAMSARGVNVTAGEQLPQNTNMVFLGNVPAGASLYFESKDNVDLRVNRGLLVSLGDAGDNFTVDLQGNKLNLPAITASAPASATPGKYATMTSVALENKSKAVEASEFETTVMQEGKLLVFTYDANYPPNAFKGVNVGGVAAKCQIVANPSQQLPTVMCTKADGSNFKSGEKVKIYATFAFQIWGQDTNDSAKATVPAGW